MTLYRIAPIAIVALTASACLPTSALALWTNLSPEPVSVTSPALESVTARAARSRQWQGGSRAVAQPGHRVAQPAVAQPAVAQPAVAQPRSGAARSGAARSGAARSGAAGNGQKRQTG
jgi:hypothetical protein